VAATGAAAATAAASLLALRPRGDDAPALLPGPLPVRKLRASSLSGLRSVVTDRSLILRYMSCSTVLFCLLYPCRHLLAFIGYMIRYHTTYNSDWLSGELLLYLPSPGQEPWLCTTN